ncbi:hypothetical protein GCM10018965_099870 [Nonomuraea roseola]
MIKTSSTASGTQIAAKHPQAPRVMSQHHRAWGGSRSWKMVRVNRQGRIIRSRLVFSLPKRNKTRSVPMPASVAERLMEQIDKFPPVSVTLPWRVPDGEPRLTYGTAATRCARAR